jgi:hypothetical protein
MRTVVVGLVFILLGAACGSTVSHQGLGTAREVGLDAGTEPGTTGTEPAAAGPADSESATPGIRTTAGASTGGRPSSGGKAAAAAPAAGKPILVGIPYLDNEQRNALMGSVGFQAAAPEDLKANYEHLLADLNARGGILGRRVEPIFHVFNLAGSRAAGEQSACADFTEDHKVNFAFSGGTTDTFARCMLRAGVGVIDTQWANLNEADYSGLGGFAQPAAIALDRRSRIEADRLVATHFFDAPAPAKVGILYYDESHFTRAAEVLEASLARHGVTVASKQSVHLPDTADEVSQIASGAQSAVLRFRSAGVTHVLTVEVDWFVTGFFGLLAANQGYYPRYGLTSDQQLGNLREQVSARTLEGAQFVGWYPVMDVSEPKEWSAESRACMDFLRGKGEPMETPQQRKGAVWSCEAVRYLEAAVKAGGEPISRDRFAAGAVALGSSYKPTSTYLTLMTPKRGAGVAAVRDGAYDTTCSCFRYTSAPQPVG